MRSEAREMYLFHPCQHVIICQFEDKIPKSALEDSPQLVPAWIWHKFNSWSKSIKPSHSSSFAEFQNTKCSGGACPCPRQKPAIAPPSNPTNLTSWINPADAKITGFCSVLMATSLNNTSFKHTISAPILSMHWSLAKDDIEDYHCLGAFTSISRCSKHLNMFSHAEISDHSIHFSTTVRHHLRLTSLWSMQRENRNS